MKTAHQITLERLKKVKLSTTSQIQHSLIVLSEIWLKLTSITAQGTQLAIKFILRVAQICSTLEKNRQKNSQVNKTE